MICNICLLFCWCGWRDGAGLGRRLLQRPGDEEGGDVVVGQVLVPPPALPGLKLVGTCQRIPGSLIQENIKIFRVVSSFCWDTILI